jgi:hypothetical protein
VLDRGCADGIIGLSDARRSGSGRRIWRPAP